MSGPGCETGFAHMTPPVLGAVRLGWVPYRGQPYQPCARTCHVCVPGEMFGWGVCEGRTVLFRTDWRHGGSQLVVAETRAQALGWWQNLLDGLAT